MSEPLYKFFPYYKLAFLVRGTDPESTYFSMPDDISKDEGSRFAVNIEIIRSQQGILSTLGMKIYNLNENHRNMIFQEPFWVDELEQTGNYKRVYLEIGYETYNGSNTHLTWQGVIKRASSYKEGNNVVTEVVANQLDYLAQNVFVQLNVDEGETLSHFFNQKLNNFIAEGKFIEDLKKEAQQRAQRDVSMFFPENTMQIKADFENDYTFKRSYPVNSGLLETIQEMKSFIPNARMMLKEKENTLYITDYFSNSGMSDVLEISPRTGLETTPRAYGNRMVVNCMFEPNLRIDTIIQLESVIQTNYSNRYKVLGYTHRLVLGEGTHASAVTEVNLMRMED